MAADRRRGRASVLEEFERLLTPRRRGSSRSPTSRTRWARSFPSGEIVELAHARGVPVLVDGAQAAPHLPVDVREPRLRLLRVLRHKIYGPTGVGVLYGRTALLEAMPPYQGGGDMIRSVTFEKTTYNELPYKFEAGTPNIAGAIGLGAALDYVSGIGLDGHRRPRARPARLRDRARCPRSPGCASSARRARRPASSRSCSTASTRTTSARCSTSEGIAIRTGHHCAQPVMDRFGIPATARASLGALQHARRDRRAGRGAPQGHRGCSADVRAPRAVPGSDPRPQQAAAELPRELPDANRKAEGYNPLCGDRATVYRPASRATC